jgi:outer membrane protein insertion porin family
MSATLKKMDRKISRLMLLIALLVYNTYTTPQEQANESLESIQKTSSHVFDQKPIIENIDIKGNSLVSAAAIKSKIPFYPGEVFDSKNTSKLIRNLYDLGYFNNIQVATEKTDTNNINLIITVTEKKKLEAVTYEGNKHVNDQDLNEKIDAARIQTLEAEELSGMAEKIKDLYREKNYHNVQITPQLMPSNGRVVAHFAINEGNISRVRRVFFTGNEKIATKTLRQTIFTREDWPLAMLDRAGTYHPDAIEYDKLTIENMYQSNGFLTAQVNDVNVSQRPDGDFDVTFTFDEGELYTIANVNAPGNDILCEDQLLQFIPVRPGQLYSKDDIRKTLDDLKTIWGEYGYIYADVHPSIKPDENNKTVDVTFNSSLGNRIRVNRINIAGNKKTIDKVIRRQITFNEGEILTTQNMENSKRNAEALGFFEKKDGVNWKILKTDEEHADLDLVLNEAKTGRIAGRLGFNGQIDKKSPTESISVGVDVQDPNLFGTGLHFNTSGTYSKEDANAAFSISNPWLFDRPIYGGVSMFTRRTEYEDFSLTVERPTEDIWGGSLSFGFRPPRFNYPQITLSSGIESIDFESNITAKKRFENPLLQNALNEFVRRKFQSGRTTWFASSVIHDRRNHPQFPTQGHFVRFDTRLAVPNELLGNFAFFKTFIDAHWYTALIEQYELVFHLHGFLGFVHDHDTFDIPYRELYHIGGSDSVRGYDFGQIGPSLFGNSLGGKKALITNAELLFPIANNGAIRGVVFYDGGASWDTPEIANPELRERVRNNNFEYRHSVGFGLHVLYPTPVRIDWGFKLDRKKRRDESISKVHISMSQEF